MAALVALAIRAGGLGAAALGISPALFALLGGLALGAGPAGFVGEKIGHWTGYRAGYAAADRQAEVNRLARDLAEARVDASNARAAADTARADASRTAAAAALAKDRTDAYARDLARHPAAACGLSDGDLARLRDNAWSVRRGPGRARPAGGR